MVTIVRRPFHRRSPVGDLARSNHPASFGAVRGAAGASVT
jgi:hypothetical protein